MKQYKRYKLGRYRESRIRLYSVIMQTIQYWKRLSKDKLFASVLLSVWIVSMIAVVAVNVSSPAAVLAADDYIDPNGDGTISENDYDSTGNQYYTEIDDKIRQPDTPDTSDNISVRNNRNATAFFSMSSIPNVSSVSQVQVWFYYNDGSSGEFFAQLYNGDETNAYTSEARLPTTNILDHWDSVTFSDLSLSQSELDNMKIRLRVDKGTGPTETNHAYAMYAEVTYTGAPSISLTTDGSVDFGTTQLDTTQDTTSSGMNDPETVQVDSGPADLDIKSTVFNDGSNTWSLGDTNGVDEVLWEFSKDETSWTTFTQADTFYTFDTNVAQGETRTLYTRLTTPTSTGSFRQHNTDVTILATTP